MTRLTQLISCAVVALLIALSFGHTGSLSLFALLSVDGGIAMLWLISAGMLGAVLVRAAGVKADRALLIATWGGMGLGMLSLAALGLGLIGALNFWTTLILLLLGPSLLLGEVLIRHGNLSLEWLNPWIESWLRQRTRTWWIWLAAAALLAMAMVYASLPPGFLWADDPLAYDVLEYHLQVPREWYEAGRIVPLEHNAFSYFPFNVEMQYLLAMHLRGGPWAGMYLAQYLTLGYMVLAVVGVYGAARQALPEGCRAGGGAIAALAMAGTPWTILLATVAYNEAGLLLYGALAIAWVLAGLLNGAPRWRGLALAGVMAGLACGVKYTAVPLLLLALPLVYWSVEFTMQWRMGMNGRALLRLSGEVGGFVLAGLLVFSPWLIRNQIWTANPVFPEAMPLLGAGHFTPQQVERWQQAHSPRPDQRGIVARTQALVRQVAIDWRYGWILWPMAIIALAFIAQRREIWLLTAMLVVIALFWIGLTHLQSRFFVLAVPIAAILIAQFARNRVIFHIAAVATVLLGIVAAGGSLMQAGPRVEQLAQISAFGLRDLSFLTPQPELIENQTNIALVGDARAFVYQVPMHNLYYRTVFDVNAVPGETAEQAWLGASVRQAISDYYLLISPAELRRFHQTYLGIPELSPIFTGHGRTVLIPPSQ